MLWCNFILGLNFISLCFKLIIIHYHTKKQKEIKFKPRINLNHNIYITHAICKLFQKIKIHLYWIHIIYIGIIFYITLSSSSSSSSSSSLSPSLRLIFLSLLTRAGLNPIFIVPWPLLWGNAFIKQMQMADANRVPSALTNRNLENCFFKFF